MITVKALADRIGRDGNTWSVNASGDLVPSAAVAQILGGSTSFAIRNNADGANNLLVTDAGVLTIRAGLDLAAGTADFPEGGSTTPTVRGRTSTTTGIAFASAALHLIANGVRPVVITSTAIDVGPAGALPLRLNNAGALSFMPDGSTVNTSLQYGGAAGTIGQYSGTQAQSYHLYNTRSSGTNYERLSIGWAANVLTIDNEAGGGGGAVRGLRIGSAGASLGFFGATPATQPTAVVDATGGGTVDTQARTAINDLLARMRTLGLIAT